MSSPFAHVLGEADLLRLLADPETPENLVLPLVEAFLYGIDPQRCGERLERGLPVLLAHPRVRSAEGAAVLARGLSARPCTEREQGQSAADRDVYDGAELTSRVLAAFEAATVAANPNEFAHLLCDRAERLVAAHGAEESEVRPLVVAIERIVAGAPEWRRPYRAAACLSRLLPVVSEPLLEYVLSSDRTPEPDDWFLWDPGRPDLEHLAHATLNRVPRLPVAAPANQVENLLTERCIALAARIFCSPGLPDGFLKRHFADWTMCAPRALPRLLTENPEVVDCLLRAGAVKEFMVAMKALESESVSDPEAARAYASLLETVRDALLLHPTGAGWPLVPLLYQTFGSAFGVALLASGVDELAWSLLSDWIMYPEDDAILHAALACPSAAVRAWLVPSREVLVSLRSRHERWAVILAALEDDPDPAVRERARDALARLRSGAGAGVRPTP